MTTVKYIYKKVLVNLIIISDQLNSKSVKTSHDLIIYGNEIFM